VRPRIGLGFVYLDFKINNVSPKLISGTLDVRHDRGLPIPTLGVQLRRWVSGNFCSKEFSQGNWVSKWNSMRYRDGTAYLPQSGFETRLRLYYMDSRLRGPRPFLGFEYYYYKQAATSRGIGNLARIPFQWGSSSTSTTAVHSDAALAGLFAAAYPSISEGRGHSGAHRP
jgi:hypothetical protein